MNVFGTFIQIGVGAIIYGITMIILRDETVKFLFDEINEKFLGRRV